jgi:hypothetical protein
LTELAFGGPRQDTITEKGKIERELVVVTRENKLTDLPERAF